MRTRRFLKCKNVNKCEQNGWPLISKYMPPTGVAPVGGNQATSRPPPFRPPLPSSPLQNRPRGGFRVAGRQTPRLPMDTRNRGMMIFQLFNFIFRNRVLLCLSVVCVVFLFWCFLVLLFFGSIGKCFLFFSSCTAGIDPDIVPARLKRQANEIADSTQLIVGK